MKHLTLFIVFFTFSILSFSQESSKNKEIYFSIPFNINNSSSPGIDFKSQIGNKTYLRYSLFNITGSFSANDKYDFNSYYIGASIGFGIERRNEINKNISLFYGMGIGAEYSFYVTETIRDDQIDSYTRSLYSGLLPLNLGLIFNVSEKLSISSEFMPYFSIRYEDHKHSLFPENNTTKTTYHVNISDFFSRVSLIYKF
ncbi:MAG: hypothetical protein C0596_08325 [Marinilabiliales bacterium]|nr:MAG: hypothetical protein C0596_08325 [Marinilabiliales bacterium]